MGKTTVKKNPVFAEVAINESDVLTSTVDLEPTSEEDDFLQASTRIMKKLKQQNKVVLSESQVRRGQGVSIYILLQVLSKKSGNICLLLV